MFIFYTIYVFRFPKYMAYFFGLTDIPMCKIDWR